MFYGQVFASGEGALPGEYASGKRLNYVPDFLSQAVFFGGFL